MRVIDIMSLEGAEGPAGPEGKQGVPGLNGTGADTGDGATASWIGQAGTVSETRKALQRNGLTGWYHVEGNGVVIDGGLTDSTVKLQEIFDAVPFGGTVYIPETGPSRWITISDTIYIAQQSVRVLSVPRDTYATSIRSTVAGLTFFKALNPSITFENVGILGDATSDYGVGATQVGIDYYGDTNANVDGKVAGCALVNLNVGVFTRGRNVLIEDNLFGGTTWPVRISGHDPAYHTGPSASDNRGHVIRMNRFHGCGPNEASALVYVDTSAGVSDLEISANFSDFQRCRGYVVTGTASKGHNRVNIRGNRSTGVNANMYELAYVNQFTITAESFYGGLTAGLNLSGLGVVLNNCVIGQISSVFGFQLNGGGVYARNCDRVGFSNTRFRQLGIDTTLGVAHAFDVDSTNTQMSFDIIRAAEYTGWGFLGSPTASSMGRYGFQASGALGSFNSTVFADDSLFVPAVDMVVSSGTPSFTPVAGGTQSLGWLLDATTAEGVAFQVPRMPSDWGAYSITAWWAPTTAGAGSVVLQSFQTPLRLGVVAGSGQVAFNDQAKAAPAVLNQVTGTLLTGFVVATPNPTQMRVIRNPAHASDTYAADIALLGVVLTRIS